MIVVSGWTGAGKSTLSQRLAAELGASVASFDWLMSGLRVEPEVWAVVESPVERQRRVGWNLLGRAAEEQLRHGRSVVLDLVAREEPRREWERLAAEHLNIDYDSAEISEWEAYLKRPRLLGTKPDTEAVAKP